MERRFDFRKASRQQVRVIMALEGPAGSGKTVSALLAAYGLCGDWDKILIADTENETALYCAGRTFGDVKIPSELNHAGFEPPYNPESWIALIAQAEQAGYDVLVLDTISHEWEGEWGCLDMASANYNNWANVTPAHRAFVRRMRQAQCHIVATLRVKSEYADIERDAGNGRRKTEKRKIGTKAAAKEGIDYEFAVVLSLDCETHLARVSKDRTGLFDGQPPFVVTPAMGQTLAAWANEGKPREPAEAAEGVELRVVMDEPIEECGEPDISVPPPPVPIRVKPRSNAADRAAVIAPWLSKIDAAAAAGSEERLDAVRAEMNEALPADRRTKGQGAALRRAIARARAAIRSIKSDGEAP